MLYLQAYGKPNKHLFTVSDIPNSN